MRQPLRGLLEPPGPLTSLLRALAFLAQSPCPAGSEPGKRHLHFRPCHLKTEAPTKLPGPSTSTAGPHHHRHRRPDPQADQGRRCGVSFHSRRHRVPRVGRCFMNFSIPSLLVAPGGSSHSQARPPGRHFPPCVLNTVRSSGCPGSLAPSITAVWFSCNILGSYMRFHLQKKKKKGILWL